MSEETNKQIDELLSKAKPIVELNLEVLPKHELPSTYKERQVRTPNYNALADYFCNPYLYKDGVWYKWDSKRLRQISRDVVEAHIDKELRIQQIDLNPKVITDIVTIIRRRITTEEKLYGAVRLDEDIARVNCNNGILVIDTELKEIIDLESHDKRWNFTKVLDAAYVPKAQCPEFLKFLNRVMPDKEDQKMFQILCVYILIDTPGLQVALFLLGPQDTGKSTLLSAVQVTLGDDNCSHATLRYMSEYRGRILDKMENRLVNTSTESDKAEIESVAALNQLISGEERVNDAKHLQEKYIALTVKPFVAANIFPSLPYGKDVDAFMKRVRIIVMNEVISASEMDRKIVNKRIKKEKDGIFAWMLCGVYAALSTNVCATGGKKSTERYSQLIIDLNPAKYFLDHCCLKQGSTVKRDFEVLYERFLKLHYADKNLSMGSQVKRMWRYFASIGVNDDRLYIGKDDRPYIVRLTVKEEWRKRLLPQEKERKHGD